MLRKALISAVHPSNQVESRYCLLVLFRNCWIEHTDCILIIIKIIFPVVPVYAMPQIFQHDWTPKMMPQTVLILPNNFNNFNLNAMQPQVMPPLPPPNMNINQGMNNNIMNQGMNNNNMNQGMNNNMNQGMNNNNMNQGIGMNSNNMNQGMGMNKNMGMQNN